MTPEDTPNMTERTDRQAQIDPLLEAFDAGQEAAGRGAPVAANPYPAGDSWGVPLAHQYWHDGHMLMTAKALLRERDAQIASLTAQVEQERHRAETFESAAGKALDARDTLRAERDDAQQEAAKWKASGDVMEAEKVRALQDAINLQQENTTLREALDKLAREALVVVGFAQASMPLSVGDIADLRRAGERGRAALSSSPRPQEPQPPEPPKPTEPRKPVVNLMEVLKKSLDSLNAKPTSQEP